MVLFVSSGTAYMLHGCVCVQLGVQILLVYDCHVLASTTASAMAMPAESVSTQLIYTYNILFSY